MAGRTLAPGPGTGWSWRDGAGRQPGPDSRAPQGPSAPAGSPTAAPHLPFPGPRLLCCRGSVRGPRARLCLRDGPSTSVDVRRFQQRAHAVPREPQNTREEGRAHLTSPASQVRTQGRGATACPRCSRSPALRPSVREAPLQRGADGPGLLPASAWWGPRWKSAVPSPGALSLDAVLCRGNQPLLT